MIVYILILHYLLYRQHIRQKRHESLTLAIVSVLQAREARDARNAREAREAREAQEAREVIEDDKYN